MRRMMMLTLLGLALVSAPAAAVTLEGTYIASVPHRPSLPSVGPDRPVDVATGELAAVYLASGKEEKPAVELALYVQGDSGLDVQPQSDQRARLHVRKGSLVLRYISAEPVIISSEAGWARLEPGEGMIRVNVTGGATEFTLIEGQGTRFEGAVPAGDVRGAPGGQAVALRPEARADAMRLIIHLVEARVLAEPDAWLRRAEAGDFVPSPQWVTPTAAVPPEYRVSTAVTQALAQAQPVVVTPPTITAPVTPTITQAQTLLASQNPASVVVGARLERTRIVGNPGAQGSGVRFNPEVRGPLNLGPRLR